MFKIKPEQKYKIKLQSPSKSLWSTFKKAFLLNKNFKKFWINYDKSNLDKLLVDTTNKFINSESYQKVSRFWCHCQINHYKSISGYSTSESIKSNIRDYARHLFFEKKDFKNILKLIKNKKSANINLFKIHDELDEYQSINYNLASLVLFSFIKKFSEQYYDIVNRKIYEKYSPSIEIDGKLYNQHFLYSLIELEKINKLINISNSNLKVLEFGAGYGRTANLFLSLSKNIKYVIVDIPPSINLSYEELKSIYKKKKIFLAIDINDKKKLNEIIDSNDVVLIFPHQLKLLKRNFFDISIMIGITLEMEPKIVKEYMDFVDQLSKSMYMKVFTYAGLPFSFYKFYKYDDKKSYHIHEDWKEIFCDVGLETDNIAHLGYKIIKN